MFSSLDDVAVVDLKYKPNYTIYFLPKMQLFESVGYHSN